MNDTPDLFEWAEQQTAGTTASQDTSPAVSRENECVPQDSPVVLVDAFSQIFRAFYAIRQLNNHRGEPVNALYIMTKLLLQINRDFPADKGAFLFDCGKVEFRLKLLPEYKANRPPMPEPLKQQMPAVEEMAAAFGWPLLRAENYEADDLIGGFANTLSERVFIVTGDKDLSSLVDERVHLLKPARSGGGFVECGPEEVVRDVGVVPELIPDYLALLGDSVDNIEGVPGIGAKSAVELLNTHGSAERWYQEDGTLRIAAGKFSAKLEGRHSLICRNLGLTRLKCDLPEQFADLKNVLSKKAPDWQKIANMCADNDFKSLLREIPAEPELPKAEGELF